MASWDRRCFTGNSLLVIYIFGLFHKVLFKISIVLYICEYVYRYLRNQKKLKHILANFPVKKFPNLKYPFQEETVRTFYFIFFKDIKNVRKPLAFFYTTRFKNKVFQHFEILKLLSFSFVKYFCFVCTSLR